MSFNYSDYDSSLDLIQYSYPPFDIPQPTHYKEIGDEAQVPSRPKTARGGGRGEPSRASKAHAQVRPSSVLGPRIKIDKKAVTTTTKKEKQLIR